MTITRTQSSRWSNSSRAARSQPSTQQVASPLGGTITVYPLTSPANSRLFVTTNGPAYNTTYDAVLFSVTRRYAKRWQGNAGYAYSRLRGLTAGAVDPNDVTNATGPQSIDRPHMFTFTGSSW